MRSPPTLPPSPPKSDSKLHKNVLPAIFSHEDTNFEVPVGILIESRTELAANSLEQKFYLKVRSHDAIFISLI